MTQSRRTFASREDILEAGYTEGWRHFAAPELNRGGIYSTAVVYARGGWREGPITKITAKYVYVDVVTPTSPTLHTVGKGSRDGSRWDLYVRPLRP